MSAGGPQGGDDGDRALVVHKDVRPLFGKITLGDIVVDKDPFDEDNGVAFIAVQDDFHAWLIVGKYSSSCDCFFVRYAPRFWVRGGRRLKLPRLDKISKFCDGKELVEKNYFELKRLKKKLKQKAFAYLGGKFITLQINRRSFCDLTIVTVVDGVKLKAGRREDADKKIGERLIFRDKEKKLLRFIEELEADCGSGDGLTKRAKHRFEELQEEKRTAVFYIEGEA